MIELTKTEASELLMSLIQFNDFLFAIDRTGTFSDSLDRSVKILNDKIKIKYKTNLDTEKLRAFAKEVMDEWPLECGLNFMDLQEIAIRHGLLEPEIRYESCVDGAFCQCAEYYNEDDFKSGVECFRKTKLLMGES
jgi:hypothetical protein